MENHRNHTRIAYAILIVILSISGAIIFERMTPEAEPATRAYLSGPDIPASKTANFIAYPNVTTSLNLTLAEPVSKAKIEVSGAGQGITILLGGRSSFSPIGTLSGRTYLIDSVAETILDEHDTPYIDLNNNSIADDFESRHRLTAEQIKAEDSKDNLTPSQKYGYYSKTGREINPLTLDTDGDGMADDTEIGAGTDPTDPGSTPIHPFAEDPWFFPSLELLGNPQLSLFFTFDNVSNRTGIETLKGHRFKLLENTSIAEGPFRHSLHMESRSTGAVSEHNPELTRLDEFAIGAWIATSDNRSRYIAFIPKREGTPAIALDFGSSMPSCAVTIGDTTYRAKTTVWRILADNQGHLLLCNRRGGTLELYIDGALDASAEIPDDSLPTLAHLLVGTGNATHDRFYGLIDNVMIFNTSLQPAEIKRLFETMYNAQDRDHDRMSDTWEEAVGLAPTSAADQNRDDDRDGLTNEEEYHHYHLTGRLMNPKKADTDGDGHSDLAEKTAGTDATDPKDLPGYRRDLIRDSTGDGIPDWWKLRFGLPITEPSSDADPDGDGLPSRNEYEYFIATGRLLSPTDSDTNHNLIGDKAEIQDGRDPTSIPRPETAIIAPGRFHIEIPRGARIISGRLALPSSDNLTLATQAGMTPYLANGMVDITPLLTSECETPSCRNVILIQDPDGRRDYHPAVTIANISVRYELAPRLPDPMPICPAYPCVIPLDVRSAAAGNITIELIDAQPCDAGCQAQATIRCPANLTCITAGQGGQREDIAVATAAPAAKPGFKIYYVVGIAAIIGLLAACAHVWLVRRKARKKTAVHGMPPAKTTKIRKTGNTGNTRDYYIKEALEYIRAAAAKGKDPDQAAARLIDSGWPKQYVEEARKSVKK